MERGIVMRRFVCLCLITLGIVASVRMASAVQLQVGAFENEENLRSRAQLIEEWGYEVHFQETAGDLTRLKTESLSGHRLLHLKQRLEARDINFIQLGMEPPPEHGTATDTTAEGLPSFIPIIQGHRRSLSDTLVEELNSVMGTEYSWGDESPRNGFDCSGLLFWLFDRETPRTVATMWPWTQQVSRENLQPGDFVFFTFDSLKEPDHVGLYLGGNKFVHASSSYGVIRADLNKAYYQRNLYGYGRPQF